MKVPKDSRLLRCFNHFPKDRSPERQEVANAVGGRHGSWYEKCYGNKHLL